MQLIKGSRVVVVGGGPAGSFSALHLLRLSEKARLDLEVVIFEARDFTKPGPGGCNKCAGILSSALLSNLNAFGLRLPDEIVQAELDTYILHLDGTQLPIHPQEPSRKIISVYRGSGPRWGTYPFPTSFDGWLLEQAREAGAKIRRTRVRSVIPRALPIVVTAQERLEADLVVIATGINNRVPLDPAWGYRQPQFEVMAQDEVLLSGNSSGRDVHIFFNHPAGLIFGGVIPKGRYANISLLGKDLPPDSIAQFLDGHELTPLLMDSPSVLCGCTPRVSISSASGYYGDRMVVVGDAAVTRLYKDGIGAAFTTAKLAMQTAISRGISRQDFAQGYQPFCRQIAVDNIFGRFLFRLWASSRSSPRLIKAWKRAVLSEALLPARLRVHERVLWGMFTGDESYRKIFFLLLSPSAFRSFMAGITKTWRRE